jgi:hypothetical protein
MVKAGPRSEPDANWGPVQDVVGVPGQAKSGDTPATIYTLQKGMILNAYQNFAPFTSNGVLNSVHGIPRFRAYNETLRFTSLISGKYKHGEDIRKSTHLRKGLKPGKIEGRPPSILEMSPIQYPLLCRES